MNRMCNHLHLTTTARVVIVAALVATVVSAARDCDECRRPSLAPLDLTHVPSHEDLIRSGQLGGNLAPTAAADRSTEADRMAFGVAMDAWNRHDYKRAKVLLKQFGEKFPASPWVAEAELHLGCEARFNGRFAEAERFFNKILADHADKKGTPFAEILFRAKLRLAMLEVMRGNFENAQTAWAEIVRTDPDRVRRDYARNWLHKTALYQSNAHIVRRCGTEALVKLLAAMGRTEGSDELLSLPANAAYGFSAAQLVNLSSEHGVSLTGVKTSDPADLPVPFLAHYEFKHFVTVTARDAQGNVTLFDPLLNHATTMTAEEFSQEWSGVALVPTERMFAGDAPVARHGPVLLAASDLNDFTGGCCGIENSNTDEGRDQTSIGGSRGTSCGLCGWHFQPTSMNVFLSDTPLWYEPAVGPSVAFSMSYNAIDADNNLSSFGPKWVFSYHSYAVETPASGGNGTVTIFMPDGANHVYSPLEGTNTFTPPGRVFNRLEKVAANQFTLTLPNGTVMEYGRPEGATNVQQALLSRILDTHSNAVTLKYDGQADPKLVEVVDALSKTSRIFYAGSGLITNIVDPSGRQMSVQYSNNLVSAVRDMGGVSSYYTFYTNGLEEDYVKTLRTDCGEVSFIYALNDEDRGGTWSRSTMMAAYPDGSTEMMYYNGGAGATTNVQFTDRNGRTTTYTIGIGQQFPYQGTIGVAAFADGTTNAFQFNSANVVTNVTDEAGLAWAFTYNNAGRLTHLKTPAGYEVSYAYTNDGFDVTSVTEGGSNVLLRMGYTTYRDVAAVTNALNQSASFWYDALGRLTNVVDALGVSNVIAYGADSWLSSVSRAGVVLANYQYDDKGRVTNSVGPENIAVAFGFDGLDRLTNMAVAAQRPYTWTYQTNSMLLSTQTDRSGRRTRFGYDAMERLHKVTLPDTSFFLLDYNSGDELSSLTDGNANKSQFAYDQRGRVKRKIYPDGTSVQAAYDARGLPVSHTSARNMVVSNQFSKDALLTNVVYSATNTPGHRFAFNNLKQMVSSADGWSTNTFVYDALGRVTNIVEVSGISTQVWAYGFDAIGRLTGMTWRITGNTNIFAAGYAYDALGRITNLSSDLGAVRYDYTNAGLQVAKMTWPNGENATNQYDSLGRLTNLAFSTGQKWRYAYDARDFITTRVDPATNTYSYEYDEAGRLAGAVCTNIANYPVHYRYDWAGNIVKASGGTVQRDRVINDNNQLSAVVWTNVIHVRGYGNEVLTQVVAKTTAPGTSWIEATLSYASATQCFFEITLDHADSSPTVWELYAKDRSSNNSYLRYTNSVPGTSVSTFAYDADGNETIVGSGYYTNSWDAANRLLTVRYTGGARTEMRYDGADRLREVVEYSSGGSPTSTVRYAWNGMLPWAELNSTNGVVRTFTWGLDISSTIGGAGGIGGLAGIRDYSGVSPSNYLVRTDGKGNVTEVRRTNGTVAASYAYAPYGSLISQTNNYNQPFRFQTKLFHAPSSYVYFGFRWYDPPRARWLSRDPIGEAGGINLYAYCGNNPGNVVDPLGLVEGDLKSSILQQALKRAGSKSSVKDLKSDPSSNIKIDPDTGKAYRVDLGDAVHNNDPNVHVFDNIKDAKRNRNCKAKIFFTKSGTIKAIGLVGGAIAVTAALDAASRSEHFSGAIQASLRGDKAGVKSELYELGFDMSIESGSSMPYFGAAAFAEYGISDNE